MALNGWTFQQNKTFEEVFPEELPDQWQKITEKASGKSDVDVYMQYGALLPDLKEIDSGKVELPLSGGSCEVSFGSRPVLARCETERKKRSWTEAERRLFLIGLQKYGKGSWKSISKLVIKTRTSTQVASHAQKYFIRQKALAEKKEKMRASVHDMSVDDLDTQANEELSSTELVSDMMHELLRPQVEPTQTYGSIPSPMAYEFPMQEASMLPLDVMPFSQFHPWNNDDHPHMCVHDLDTQATKELRSTELVSDMTHEFLKSQVGPTHTYGSILSPMAYELPMQEASILPFNVMPFSQFHPWNNDYHPHMSVHDLDTQATKELSSIELVSDMTHELLRPQVGPTQTYGSILSPMAYELPMQEASMLPFSIMPFSQFHPWKKDDHPHMNVHDLDTQATKELSSTELVLDMTHELLRPQVGPTQTYGSIPSPMAYELPMQEAPMSPCNVMPLSQFHPWNKDGHPHISSMASWS
ncbi:hypothetical protein AMTRI_Chr11g151040 [Amborella trichopoda]